MISERYLDRLRVRISWRKVFNVDGVIAVRSLLMKAVFFFREESREELTGKTSMEGRGQSVSRIRDRSTDEIH